MQIDYFGNNSIQKLEIILNNYNPKKIFLVTGGRSYQVSGAQDEIEEKLLGTEYYHYCGFEENPKFEELIEGARIFQEYNPDLIIAIGGGSVLDTAKVISILPPDKPQAERIVTGDFKGLDKKTPLIAIPTTSGSGSEATHFAVVYKDGSKYSIAHKTLLPEYVLLVPKFTYSMSKYQTAVSGMDAVCQGIESVWAKGGNTESFEYAKKGLKLVLDNLEPAVNSPNEENRTNMILGAYLVGKGINISKTTAGHALSYGLTSKFGLPHGHAVGTIMCSLIGLTCEKLSLEQSSKGSKVLDALKEVLDISSIDQIKPIFLSLVQSVGLDKPDKLSGYYSNKILKGLVEDVNLERLSNHPVDLSKNDIQDIYQKTLNG